MRRTFGLFGLVLAAACNWGTRPKDFAFAMRPEGATVAVRLTNESADRVGELLAADSAGITVRGERVLRMTWARVAAMDVHGFGDDYDVHTGEWVSPGKIARLALVSRFPQGMANLPIKLDSLIALTSAATAKYADRREAVNDGYMRVGTDFPSMGEHWLNTAQLRASRVDPARPTLLIYATIAGAPRLLGAGFVLVTRGDARPTDAPGWPDAWHEHSGLLSDESGAAHHRADGGDTHVWVMHAWTVLENPDGAFAADNWALPYLRAGLTVPTVRDADAARSLSLVVGGDAYLSDLLSDAGLRTSENAASVDAAIAAARARVAARPADANGAEWSRLTESLERILGAGVRPFLAPAHANHP